jgi:hypothetical protein
VIGALAKVVAGPVSVGAAVRQYGLVPARFTYAVAIALPALELVAGIGLFSDALAVPAAIVGLAVVLVVSLAVVVNLVRGRRFPCGCLGGLSDRGVSWGLVVQNVIVIVVLSALAALASGVALWDRVSATDGLAAIAMSIAVVFLLIAWGQIEDIVAAFDEYRVEFSEAVERTPGGPGGTDSGTSSQEGAAQA